MNVLITGASGFMGSNMVHYLLASDSDVRLLNLDKMTYAGNATNLEDVQEDPRYQFMQGDIANEQDVARACETVQPDVILNYAAETHVDRSILDPKAFLITDVVGTYTLLEAVKKYGIKKLVQISTDEVFGSTTEGAFTEQSPFEPNSPYSASKAGGDHLCRAYWVTYNTPVVVTHSCNFYGPYQYPEKIIPLFITNILEEKKVPLYGTGENVREWIYTEDHCRAVDTIMRNGTPGEVYNIGSGQRISNSELTHRILALLGKDEEMIEHVQDRPGHDFRYAIDHTKLTKELGWEPSVALEDGLRRTVEWYTAHEQWWKPLKSGAYKAYYEQQYGNRSRT